MNLLPLYYFMNCEILRFASKMPEKKGGGVTQNYNVWCSLVHYRFHKYHPFYHHNYHNSCSCVAITSLTIHPNNTAIHWPCYTHTLNIRYYHNFSFHGRNVCSLWSERFFFLHSYYSEKITVWNKCVWMFVNQ